MSSPSAAAATPDASKPNTPTQVQEIEVSTVKAANNTEVGRIEFTPWELQLLLLEPIQKGLLFRKPPNHEQTSVVSCLRDSLSRTLDLFTPLAGRFAETTHDDVTVSYHIDCNNAGALFTHAVANGLTISDILEPIYSPKILSSFFTLTGVQNIEGISKPLLGIQVTELVDGIFIGCSFNHAVADGTSYWNFLKVWSQMNRGLDLIVDIKPPVLDRYFIGGVEPPIRFSLPEAFSFKKLPRGNDANARMEPLKERVFHFTKGNISKLKAKANDEMVTTRISSLQSLLAHLWQAIVRNQNHDPTQDVHYKITMGARPRLHSELLSEQYFGVAVLVDSVTVKAGELLEHGIGYAAMQMNKVVALYTEEKFKEFLKSWKENPKVLTVSTTNKNAVVTSSSPRFDIFVNDFGWGKPVAARSGHGNKNEGKVTLYNGVEEGSVDIEVCLLPETLEALGNDPVFMAAVGY